MICSLMRRSVLMRSWRSLARVRLRRGIINPATLTELRQTILER